MNHYERLKVSRDAPPEVIRAAYRALATRLHPDRQGADMAAQHAMHEQMVALNAAYEVLIDPKLRHDYDATLAPSHELGSEVDTTVYGGGDQPGHQARVDMGWLPPKAAKAQMLSPSSRPLAMVAGGIALLLLVAAGVAFWRMYSHQQMEQALSEQYVRGGVAQPSATAAVDARAPVSPAPAAGARRRPTVEELALMSDEELMRVLPTLDGHGDTPQAVAQTPRSAAKANAHHPLDGQPMNLRADTQLIDPLAPPKGKAGP